MRRLSEGHESPSLTTSGAGVLTSTSWREIAPYFAFALTCFLIAPYIGLSSREVDPRIAEVWPPGGVAFVLLTVIWYAGRRLVAGTLALMLVTFALTGLVMGEGVGWSLWWALAAIGQAALMGLAYRRLLGHPGWVPETPRDVGALFVSTVGSSLVCGLLGGFPSVEPGELSRVLLWWVIRNSVFCFVGAATFMVIFYRRSGDALRPTPMSNRVWLLVATILCVFGTYHDPSLPLSWLLIVPSVWGGLTLTVRGAAFLVLTVALLAAAMTYLPQNQFGYVGWLPAASIVDLLVIASTAFTLLLALMREQRATLIAELDRKGAESEAQRSMLATVFDSMTDGVMIVGTEGVSLHNNAARQLLGRPIPTGVAHSWVDTFTATAADGSPIDDSWVRRELFDEHGAATGASVEISVGEEGNSRVLDLSAQPLEVGDKRALAMMLVHDVTNQRARLRELTNFAGIVAHDLRGPLTVLDGWLEFAEDGRDETDPEAVDNALVRARDASKRMRQVIEDWLGYTVVQNGQLHPVPVRLEALASEIVESHRARWVEDDQLRFTLDLSHSVEADPAMLRQLIDNLVGNAVKYTAPGEPPTIALTSHADDEPGWIRVEVSDLGVGIPAGQEELIFEEFHRGPVQGRTAGTGLGLALTRRIVALHGGRLEARRNPEGGSTFSFTLPES